MPKPSYERVINDEKEKENNSHPLSSASFFSQLTFWWMFKTLKTGNKCPLERADFLPLHEADRTEELTERFRNLWNNTLHKCDEKGKQPKLWKCVLRFISFKEVCVVLWIWMLEATCRILQPWILGILVSLLMQPEYDRRLAYACAGLLALVALVCASAHVASFKCEMLGLRLSSALRGIVYLKVSRSASFKIKKTLVFVITSVIQKKAVLHGTTCKVNFSPNKLREKLALLVVLCNTALRHQLKSSRKILVGVHLFVLA